MERFLKWSFIKSIQNLKIVKSTYLWLFLLPILAKFIYKLEDILKLNFGTLPFSWKMLFVCAFLFTIANIIYFVFCPRIIKENNDYGDFIRKHKDRWHLEEYMPKTLLSKWKEELSGINDDEWQLSQNTQATENNLAVITAFNLKKDQRIRNNIKELMDSYFWIIFKNRDTEWLYARLIIMLLNIISGVIFAYILWLNIEFVLCSVLNKS